MTNRVTRLAPSPTGTLHLGNARTFLVNWALARASNWRIVMRIEDLDRQRVRSGAAESLLNTLTWLEIDFDDGPCWQSADCDPYRHAMRNLTDSRVIYQCSLTRSEIQHAASAPHADEGELRFPPHLRPADPDRYQLTREDANYRFIVPQCAVTIDDQCAGRHVFKPCEEVGDFIVWTKLGVPAYQLAVVVDDARQGVTDVVRGDDLLASAARQSLIYRALRLSEPRWWHLPLVLGPDGRRLAKRHGDTHVETYRAAGVRPQRVIGLLAKWCNACDECVEMSAGDFLRAFRIDRLSKSPVTFTQEDHQWLLQGT